jgi:TRAP-type C4-dicarboxylate transport system substrate-binding protein
MGLRWLRALAIVPVLIAGHAYAQSNTAARKLRVGDSFPVGHYLVRYLLQPWMDQVTKQTSGAITFDYYPAQQLGKASDLLTLTQTGVIDIGYVGPTYVSDKMPLSEVAQLPGVFLSSCQGTLAYWKLARTGVLRDQEFDANKVHILLTIVLPPYHILTTNKEIKTKDDVQGLKLRSTGGAMDLMTRALNAVPVRIAAPDAYESVSRGTIDGLIFPLESVISYGMDKLMKNATEGVGFGSFIVTYVISDRLWKQLPADVQKAMDQAGDAIVPQACAKVDDDTGGAKAKLEAAGVKFTPLDATAREGFNEVLKGVAGAWAEQLDKRGKKASETLKEFRAAVQESPAKQ